MLLLENYREEQGLSLTQTRPNLSKLPSEAIVALKALLKGATVLGTGPGELVVERSLPHRHVAEALGTIRKIAVDRLIRARKEMRLRRVTAI